MKHLKNKDSIIFTVIYLGTLGIMLNYVLNNPTINDRVLEYREYLLNIEQGWVYRYSSINSCLLSIWLPAMIQKYTHIDSNLLFRVYPTLFYAMMPAFVYLIARRYLTIRLSVVSALVIILSSYIFFYPDLGRVGISLGIWAMMVWALLANKLKLSIASATMLVFAHYGLTIIAIGFILSIVGLLLITSRGKSWGVVKITVLTLVVLVALTGVWHFGIAHYSGDSMMDTLLRPSEAMGVLEELGWDSYSEDFMSLESRDYVVQEAFGLHFLTNPLPLKIEIVINWFVVLFITFGAYIMLRLKSVDIMFKAMIIVLYSLIILTIAFPPISVFYGTQRVYFTACTVLVICFSFGVKGLSDKLRLQPLFVSSIILAVYALATSGLLYTLFGLTKTLPVVLTPEIIPEVFTSP